MPAPTGKRLERLVAAIQAAQSQGAVVTWNDTIEGRQFDVTVRFKYGLHSYLTVIECKEYASKIPVEKVDALATKARDAKANKAVLVSTRGFQSGCFPVAERHGIQLLVLTETSTTTEASLIERITPALNVFAVQFTRPGDEPVVEFEDWGGRMTYLMHQSVIQSASEAVSPEALIARWQRSNPGLDPKERNSVEIPFAPGTTLAIPNEPPVPVTAIRFTCVFIELQVSKVPVPDKHIWESMASKVELRDEQGNLVHSAALSDVPVGFDTTVEPGKFYEAPALFNRYYCEKIEGEVVSWILIESYQHGRLWQAAFTQKLRFADSYVPVTDKAVLLRLEQFLQRYQVRDPKRDWKTSQS